MMYSKEILCNTGLISWIPWCLLLFFRSEVFCVGFLCHRPIILGLWFLWVEDKILSGPMGSSAAFLYTHSCITSPTQAHMCLYRHIDKKQTSKALDVSSKELPKNMTPDPSCPIHWPLALCGHSSLWFKCTFLEKIQFFPCTSHSASTQ